MKPTPPPFLIAPSVNLSLCFALASATVAFAIISQNLLFTLGIAAGSLFLRSLSSTLSPRIHYAARFAFTFGAYLAAILPLWTDPLTDYYSLPLLVSIAIPLLASLNQKSEGGSRGFTSIAAVAFILFIRNIVLYFDFEAPIQDLSQTIAFIAFLEIALSSRFQNGEDSPHPELIFGLLLALIVSFHLESLPLALALAALPLAAFLLRNYQFAKIANEHARPTQTVSHRPTAPNTTLRLVILTLIPIATLLYLLVLRVPFWADFIPQRAPYIAKQIANKANAIAEAADLENDSIETFADTVISQDFIAKKSSQLIESFKPKPIEIKILPPGTPPLNPRHQNLETLENEYYPHVLKPEEKGRGFSQNSITISGLNTSPIETPPPANLPKPTPRNDTAKIPKHAGVTPPQVSLGSGIPLNILPSADQTPVANNQQSPPTKDQLDTDLSPFLNPEKTRTESGNFNRFLDTFAQPGQAIARSLNLQGSDVSALLDEKPLVIVTLEKSRHAPRRLYLRSNVLDTISSNGVDAIRDADGRIELSATGQGLLTLPGFRLSNSDGEPITVTSDQSRSPTLPLPESLSQIEILGTGSIQVYPEERVALLPYTQDPVTYRIYDADLEIAERERHTTAPSESYRQRMLEVPLRKTDRNTLNSLAKRIGGSRTSTQAFADRVSNYFKNKHPYSYFVEIPDGPGHAVVRWLENECPGLCSNYAAAFTLLARSRGIPARVVSGFASEEFSPAEKRYTFRQSNAHAWVEYLDESNTWVRFDPTPVISETERRRAAPFATAANPESLNQLIQSEQKSLAQQKQTKPQEEAPTQIASNPTPAPAQEPEPTQTTSTTTTSPNSTPAPARPDTTPYPQTKPNTPPKADPTPREPLAKTPPAISPQTPNPKKQQLPTPVDETRTTASSGRTPWLLLLSVLAIGIPAALYLFRLRSTQKTTSPQLRLRHKAGRLLSQLDTLIQRHHLEEDPVWTETRQTLSAQRYGRETNSTLIQDLAIKIALLAKKR